MPTRRTAGTPRRHRRDQERRDAALWPAAPKPKVRAAAKLSKEFGELEYLETMTWLRILSPRSPHRRPRRWRRCARSPSKVGVLPRVHGSALFTRGETQAHRGPTLGTAPRWPDDRRGLRRGEQRPASCSTTTSPRTRWAKTGRMMGAEAPRSRPRQAGQARRAGRDAGPWKPSRTPSAWSRKSPNRMVPPPWLRSAAARWR